MELGLIIAGILVCAALIFVGIIFFFIALIGAIKKRLTVYYDISDALISLILFSIIGYATGYFTAPLYSSNGYVEKILDIITFKEPVDGVMLGLLAVVLLNLAFIVYSFYMAYIYNKRRKGFIVAAFVGRCATLYTLSMAVNFIIVFSLGGYHGVFPSFLGSSFGLNIAILAVVIPISLLVMGAFIRYFEFSDFSNYFNFQHLMSLRDELAEGYKKTANNTSKVKRLD